MPTVAADCHVPALVLSYFVLRVLKHVKHVNVQPLGVGVLSTFEFDCHSGIVVDQVYSLVHNQRRRTCICTFVYRVQQGKTDQHSDEGCRECIGYPPTKHRGGTEMMIVLKFTYILFVF